MGQLMLIAEYIIDTSSILSQKSSQSFKRKVYKTGWQYIDECLLKGRIVTCSEIQEEIRDIEIKKWLIDNQCEIIGIDDEIQKNVKRVVKDNPKMISFTKNGHDTSSGDAFLIATAMSHNLSIITEENKDKLNKIPQICKKYDILTLSLLDFWEKEGLSF